MIIEINNKNYKISLLRDYRFKIICDASECKFFIDWIICNDTISNKYDFIAKHSNYYDFIAKHSNYYDSILYGCRPISISGNKIIFIYNDSFTFNNEIRRRDDKFSKLMCDV